MMNTETTRRAFVAGAGIVTASAAVAVPVLARAPDPDADAELLATAEEWWGMVLESCRDSPVIDGDGWWDHYFTFEKRILDLPAHTPRGAAAKLRVAFVWSSGLTMNDFVTSIPGGPEGERHLWVIVEALEAMG